MHILVILTMAPVIWNIVINPQSVKFACLRLWGGWKRRTRSDMDADTDIFKKHFYIYITVIFMPNVVFTAVYASRPLIVIALIHL